VFEFMVGGEDLPAAAMRDRTDKKIDGRSGHAAAPAEIVHVGRAS